MTTSGMDPCTDAPSICERASAVVNACALRSRREELAAQLAIARAVFLELRALHRTPAVRRDTSTPSCFELNWPADTSVSQATVQSLFYRSAICACRCGFEASSSPPLSQPHLRWCSMHSASMFGAGGVQCDSEFGCAAAAPFSAPAARLLHQRAASLCVNTQADGIVPIKRNTAQIFDLLKQICVFVRQGLTETKRARARCQAVEVFECVQAECMPDHGAIYPSRASVRITSTHADTSRACAS